MKFFNSLLNLVGLGKKEELPKQTLLKDVMIPMPIIKLKTDITIHEQPKQIPISDIKITEEQLRKLGVSKTNIDKYWLFLNETLVKYQINTPLRISHFLSQLLHESGNFKYSEEIATGAAYEGRKDLGNNQPGDGKRFKGRGLIQITGRNNYKKYSDFVDVDFLSRSNMLSEPKYAMDSAGHFWVTKIVSGNNLNYYADQNNFIKLTYFINGGTNGLRDRYEKLIKCFDLFNVPPEKSNDIAQYIKAIINKKTGLSPMEKAVVRVIPNKTKLNEFFK